MNYKYKGYLNKRQSLKTSHFSYLAVGGFDWNLVFNWHGVCTLKSFIFENLTNLFLSGA